MINDKYFSAGIVIRIIACIIDILIIQAPLVIITYLFYSDFNNGSEFYRALDSIIYLIYLTVTPIFWDGHVIGKRLCKIRIVKKHDEPLTLYHMFMREVIGKYLLGLISFGVTTIVSVFMISLRDDKRAIHDIIAGTFVEQYY